MPIDDARHAMVDMRDEYDLLRSLIILGGLISLSEYSSIRTSWSSSLRKRGKAAGAVPTGKHSSSPASICDRKSIASKPSLDSILDRVYSQGSQEKRQGEENPLAVIDEQNIIVSSFLNRHGGYKKKPQNPR